MFLSYGDFVYTMQALQIMSVNSVLFSKSCKWRDELTQLLVSDTQTKSRSWNNHELSLISNNLSVLSLWHLQRAALVRPRYCDHTSVVLHILWWKLNVYFWRYIHSAFLNSVWACEIVLGKTAEFMWMIDASLAHILTV